MEIQWLLGQTEVFIDKAFQLKIHLILCNKSLQLPVFQVFFNDLPDHINAFPGSVNWLPVGINWLHVGVNFFPDAGKVWLYVVNRLCVNVNVWNNLAGFPLLFSKGS